MFKIKDNTIQRDGQVLTEFDSKVLIGNTLYLYLNKQEVLMVNASLVASDDPADKPDPAPVKTTSQRGKRATKPTAE